MHSFRDMLLGRTRARTVALTILAGLISASLVACGGTGSDSDESQSGSTTGAEEDPAESESPEQSAGVLIDRPNYSVHLPEIWTDTTDEAMITPLPNDFRSSAPRAGTEDVASADVVTFEESDYDSIEERKPLGLESAKGLSPKQKFDGTGTFADEDAILFAGPGLTPGSFTQTYEFLHHGMLYQLRVESLSGKQEAQTIVKELESTWEWK